MKQTTPQVRAAIKSPAGHWVIIVIGLLLSFVDMLLLSGAIENLADVDQVNASILALMIALVGSITALLWGRSIAQHPEKRKWHHIEAWIWASIGVLFIVIRAATMYMDLVDIDPEEVFGIVASESLMAIMLTILYVGTGFILRMEAQKAFDTTRYALWHNIRAAKMLQSKIANKYAESERIIIELESFYKFYGSVNRQYVIRRNSVQDAERATLSTVAKRVLEDNPQLDPQVVDDILQAMLAERKIKE